MTSFADLRLEPTLLEALDDVGYEEPSPIQAEAIPPLLEGRDVIGQAQTGSGKTAAFGLPLIQYTDPADNSIQALVLTPTRELANQVKNVLAPLGKVRGVRVSAVYGGASMERQITDRKSVV